MALQESSIITSSEEPWHSRLSIASTYLNFAAEFHRANEHPFYDADDYDDDVLMELFGTPIDNRSHQCFSSCLPCPDDRPLWWLVLRWMKMMLLKIARSYHAKPLLLVVPPLMVGLFVGYWLGRRQPKTRTVFHSQSATQQQQNISEERSKVGSQGFLQSVIGWMWVLFFQLYSIFPTWEDNNNDHKKNTFTFKSVSTPLNTSELMPTTAKLSVKPTILAMSNETKRSTNDNIHNTRDKDESNLEKREATVRTNLKNQDGAARESGVPLPQVPRHVAVIMDGNRRYGKARYGSAARGHWDGSSKLVEFATWCISEQIKVLTVFAFSSENWNRDPAEIASLMQIFAKYCDELRLEALKRNIKIVVLSTGFEQIPTHVQDGLKRMVSETEHCNGMIMNICMSYGSRGEIVAAAQSIAQDVLQGKIKDPKTYITENTFQDRLLTRHCGVDPDVLIRTSGEVRMSNFMLWQLAYTEMFFVEKPWPAIDKDDLLHIIRTYAEGRSRRFGK